MHPDVTYDGQRLNWNGHGTFAATSGLPDFQSPQFQCFPDAGPVLEGRYTFSLTLPIERPRGSPALSPHRRVTSSYLMDALITLMEQFVSGEAISVRDANRLEGLILEVVPEFPELEHLADDLAQYRPEGGDYLYDLAFMKSRVAFHLAALRARLQEAAPVLPRTPAGAPGVSAFVATRRVSGGRGEDRVMVEQADGRTLLVVADGAGGTGSGAAAADLACNLVAAAFRRGGMSAASWVAELSAIDRTLLTGAPGGQTTVVAVEVDGDEVRGASVGDSGCWAIDSSGCVDLTSGQSRKPLLGSGAARPTVIGPTRLPPRLLVATDGLLKYCPRAEIVRIVVNGTPENAVEELISKVRLGSGRFQDDVAIALLAGAVAGEPASTPADQQER